MRKNLLVSLAVSLLLLVNAYGQKKAVGQTTPSAGRASGGGQGADRPGQALGTNGVTDGDTCGATQVATHKFRQLGEKIEIPIRGERVPAGVADCEPVSLELHWANGRNNGSNFNVTFLDNNNRPIFARQITAFLSGVIQFPLSSFETHSSSSVAMIGVPALVTIQAVPPFAAPAGLSYTVTRVARATGAGGRSSRQEANGRPANQGNQGNEVVSIQHAVRLIGASRLPLVQIELKTSRPFPVKDAPLQLQIGKKVFLDELSGDYTGRKLTLSLTPEMFAELTDGDEIMAFFGKPEGHGSADGDVWKFGKLIKNRRR